MVPEREVDQPQEGGFPKIRGYLLEGVLGKGATGVVYRATQLAVDRQVALKILHSELVGTKRAVRRLQREARTAARLAHPSIISAIDMGEIDGQWWYAMELVEGQSLSQRLHEGGPLSERDALRLFIPLCDALQHAHEGSVVHRDVKPANILIDTRGLARLVDLGLAFAEDDPMLTSPGGTLGTPHYISPEQARDPSSADTRSDIWSLGATMYHALAGHPPFDGDSVAEILSGVLYHRIPDPRHEAPQISKGLALVVRKCLTRDPAGRYQAPADLMRDLERIRERRNPEVRAGALDPVKDDPPAWRSPLALAAIALAIVAAGWLVVAAPWRDAPLQVNGNEEANREYAPLVSKLNQLRDESITLRRASDDLNQMLGRVPERFDAALGDALREVEEELDRRLRELKKRPEEKLAAQLIAHEFVDAERTLDTELFSELRETTGYTTFAQLPGGRPTQYTDWLQALHKRLDAYRASALKTARTKLEKHYDEVILALANKQKGARHWRDALQTLEALPSEWETSANLRQLTPGDLEPVYRALKSNQDLDKRLVGLDYDTVDNALQGWANTTVLRLRKRLELGLESQVGEKLRAEFRVQLEHRGLQTDQFLQPATVLQYVEDLALGLDQEELALMERDAVRLFEYDDRTGAELCRARDYRAASEHWDALIEDDWRAAVTDRMLLRRRECSLLSGLLKRAEQGVFEASGKTVELLWSGTISVNGVLAAGADPLRRGFELRERGKPKWRFVLVPGALEAGGDQSVVLPEDLLELAGNAQVGSSPDERLVRALFLYHEERFRSARLALPLGSRDVLVGDLRTRIEAAISVEASERSARTDDLKFELRSIRLELENYGPSMRFRSRVVDVLQGFKEDLLAADRQMLEDVLESIDRVAREPDIQEVFRPDVFKALVSKRVEMTWSFLDSSEGGAWSHGNWERSPDGFHLSKSVAGDRDFLRRDSAPALVLADPLDYSQAMSVALSLEHLEGLDQGNEVLITIAGFHVVFHHWLDDPGGPRVLIDTGDPGDVLERCRNGEGESYSGFERGRVFRLDFELKQIGGHLTVELDGVPLHSRGSSFVAPDADRRTIEVHSRRPLRLRGATVEGKRK